MPPIYVKPENALKRSEELLALGTTQSQQQAFENLNEVFQSKRFKHTAIQVLEPITIKFIDLCVEMSRKSHARQALLTYKNAAQGISIPSIELVLNRFISQSEARLTSAIEQAKTEVAALPGDSSVDDDELPLQPSTILLDSFIDSAGDKERIERRLIVPAQKFCWDAYDISLDIAKGNDRLEIIYQSIAHRAFNFCKVHQRKSDFRRLCEQRLRKDLANATKYGHQQHAVNLADPETLSRHLDTRFLQLETAVELELWQEAFRSVEDIHGLVAGKKTAKPGMMANYYEKLTQIFKAEGGKQTAVFHAAAWARYYQYAERAGSVPERAAGSVLLSALSVPLGDIEGKQRLVALLNLAKMPTRQALVKDAAAKHFKRVSPELRQVYNVIENDFQPLKACKALAPLVSSLSPEYAAYLPALKEVVLSRLLQQLSQVYDTVSLSHILKLVEPFSAGPWATDMQSLEKFLMTACRRGDVNASVDHVAQSITFATSDSSDVNRLQNLAICLHNTIQYINPTTAAITARADAFAAAIAMAEEERKATAHRRQIVTKRRELMEEANLRREREESTAKAERAKALAEETARKEKEAVRLADLDRLQKQMEATRRDEAKKLAQTLADKGIKLKVDISTIEELDTSKLVTLQVEQVAKEKRELNERLRIVSKRVDHLERAFRKEERPLLVADYERQKKEDKVDHERSNVAAKEQAIHDQKTRLEAKTRLSRMMPDYLVAREKVESQQKAEFESARKSAAKKIEEEKAKFKAGVVARRKEERQRREAEEAQREEEDRLAAEREEAEAAAQAEEEAKHAQAKAEIEKRNAEAAERSAKAKADRDAEKAADLEKIRKQREREEEAEKRRAERASGGGGYRPSAPATATNAPPASIAPTAVKPGSWRDKLAARQAGGEVPPASGDASPLAAPPVAAAAAPSSVPPPTANGEERGQPPMRGRWSAARGRGGATGGAGTPPPASRGGAGGSRW
ncbi:translation initiation factor 3 subunit A, partial [Tremellales sp. Uapishka_1]